MNLKEKIPDPISEKLENLEHDYRFDQKEFGKVLTIASLSMLIVSLHALFTIDGAVEQASNSTERIDTTARLLSTDSFQQSMDALESTGVTVNGRSIQEVVSELEYMSQSVEEMEDLSQELENAQTTYQWTVLISILGLVAGITSIYI